MSAARRLLFSLSTQPRRPALPASLSAAVRLLYNTPIQRVEMMSLLPRSEAVGEVWNGPREEKFIPVTRRSLVRRLGEEEGLLSWEEREKLEIFAAALDARFSQRFQGCLEEAKVNTHTHTHTPLLLCTYGLCPSQYLYDAMDPDKDTVTTLQLNRKQLLDREHQLLLLVQRLLDKANYFQVSSCSQIFRALYICII